MNPVGVALDGNGVATAANQSTTAGCSLAGGPQGAVPGRPRPPGKLPATHASRDNTSGSSSRRTAKAVTTTWPFITAGNCYGTCCQFVIYPALLVAQPSQLFQRKRLHTPPLLLAR
jgi:hypothetical protein